MLYKVLRDLEGNVVHGRGKWHMPTSDQPGEWMPAIKGPLVECKNGYHLVEREGLVDWLNAVICEVEHGGEFIRKTGDQHMLVVREARILRVLDTWNERTARLFACDCAEAVIPIFEKLGGDGAILHNALKVARAYVKDEATAKELAAARAAACTPATKETDHETQG